MDATTVAMDLAKDVFEVATANRLGRILEGRRLTRRQFEGVVDALPAGITVVMEACGTAHYWGRRCQAHGHHVQLLPVEYVKPYVRRKSKPERWQCTRCRAARCRTRDGYRRTKRSTLLQHCAGTAACSSARVLPFLVDESRERRGRSRAAAHRIPSNLARKICRNMGFQRLANPSRLSAASN
jgi:hypothetical protein